MFGVESSLGQIPCYGIYKETRRETGRVFALPQTNKIRPDSFVSARPLWLGPAHEPTKQHQTLLCWSICVGRRLGSLICRLFCLGRYIRYSLRSYCSFQRVNDCVTSLFYFSSMNNIVEVPSQRPMRGQVLSTTKG